MNLLKSSDLFWQTCIILGERQKHKKLPMEGEELVKLIAYSREGKLWAGDSWLGSDRFPD